MEKPFLEHVHELRRRLGVCAGVVALGAGVGYIEREPILSWLQAPLHGSLYYSDVMGAFNFIMQACLMLGVLCAVPVLVYNLVAFVRPALPRPVSRRQIIGLVAASSALTVGGAAFAYYISLPIVLHFLSSIDVSHLHPLIAANSYLSFVLNYLAVFAIIFQLPLIILFIDRIRPIPPSVLKKFRKWVVIGAFGSALILPIAPDPLSQMSLALPIVVLYEFTLWLIVIAHHRRGRRVQPSPNPVPTQQHQTPQVSPSPDPVPPPALALAPQSLMSRQSYSSRPYVLDLRANVLDLRNAAK